MSGRLVSLHFLARERTNDAKLIRLPDGRYQTGNWKVARHVAEHPHPVETRRMVFSFTRDDALRRQDPDGWGTGAEKKYVRVK